MLFISEIIIEDYLIVKCVVVEYWLNKIFFSNKEIIVLW